MSRTDVHRPWRVQVADPYNRHRLVCYPAFPWAVDWWPLYNVCGCELCTGRFSRRYRHRQERAAWRSLRRDLLTTHDRDDWDVPPFTGKAW